MQRLLSRHLVSLLLLLAGAASLAGMPPIELTIDAPPSLQAAAARVRDIDRQLLADALARAGLDVPSRVHVTLIPEDDPRARATPAWIAGRAFGSRDVVLFPARVGSYPHDSMESVVRHEVVHLALFLQAGGRPLPRWFHEGVAVSVEHGWGVTSQVRLLLATVGDPGLADLGRLFESDARPETTRAYLLAAALIADVRQRHGPAAPGAIARHVAGGMPFPQAFELQTGETPGQAAARAWRVYRRWTSWIPVVTSASAVWVTILAVAVIAFIARLRQRARRRRQWNEDDGDPADW